MILTKEGIDYYYLYDYESGAPYRVTKEHYESHQKMIEEMSLRISEMSNGTLKGQIMIFGTGGDFEHGDTHMFYDNPNFKTFPNIWQESSNNQNP